MMRRALIVTGILALVVLLAFPMRQAVYEAVVIPVAYLIWALGLLYHALPQVDWWVAALVVVLYWFVKSLVPPARPPERERPSRGPLKGQAELLAEVLRKSEKGVYNKWLVANRLGKLAYQLLLQREYGKPRSQFAPLDGPDWNAPPRVTAYLQSGLQGSFADFPAGRNPFARPAQTPLDHDVKVVMDFLESKLDHMNDSHL